MFLTQRALLVVAAGAGASAFTSPLYNTKAFVSKPNARATTFLASTATEVSTLSTALLPTLSENPSISVPTYDRSALKPGIVHIGVGNFHRAHQAFYLDALFEQDLANNDQWGIVGASLFGTAKRDQLSKQDLLQTIVSQDGNSQNARIIGPMIDFLAGESDRPAIQDRLAKEDIKIVSLTVTEGGYFLKDGQFSTDDELIQHDIANPEAPKTVFGMINKALKARKDANLPPLTVLSCDNLPHNGDVVHSVLIGLAEHQYDADFASWIKDNVSCPNNMVDRITPATTDEQREIIKSEYGYQDDWPIFCEPFTQWVLEDNFPQGRPALESLDSVTFVEDVSPYEFMKIRILNGGHASLCYPSALLDVPYVHESLEHPTIGKFLDTLEHNEIIPTVGPVPDTSLTEYWDIVAERFANPTIKDTIPRICFGGASNQPKFTIPVAADNLKAGRSVDGIALVSAMWSRYVLGKTESGKDIEANDPQWDRLQEVANKAKEDPKVWLDSLPDVYGEVGKNDVFAEAFTKAYKVVAEDGAEAAMKQYIASKE